MCLQTLAYELGRYLCRCGRSWPQVCDRWKGHIAWPDVEQGYFDEAANRLAD